MSAYIDIPLTTGRWLTLQRLSVFARLEFSYHIRQAYKLLSEDPQQRIREFYVRNTEFRHHCDCSLNLHHIPPDMISDDQFIALLFGSPAFPLGVLNQFNFDLSESTQNAKAPEKETKGSILGKLFRATGDIQIAIRMAKELPVDVLEDMFEELKPEEEKYKELARNAISGITRASQHPG